MEITFHGGLHGRQPGLNLGCLHWHHKRPNQVPVRTLSLHTRVPLVEVKEDVVAEAVSFNRLTQ